MGLSLQVTSLLTNIGTKSKAINMEQRSRDRDKMRNKRLWLCLRITVCSSHDPCCVTSHSFTRSDVRTRSNIDAKYEVRRGYKKEAPNRFCCSHSSSLAYELP